MFAAWCIRSRSANPKAVDFYPIGHSPAKREYIFISNVALRMEGLRRHGKDMWKSIQRFSLKGRRGKGVQGAGLIMGCHRPFFSFSFGCAHEALDVP